MKQLAFAILFITILQLTAYSQIEDFVYSDSSKITLIEKDDKLDLKVFPNPTKIQKTILKTPKDEISEIKLISIVGKDIIQKNLEPGVHQYELNLQGIPEGVYLIQVKTTENKSMVKKLLISEN